MCIWRPNQAGRGHDEARGSQGMADADRRMTGTSGVVYQGGHSGLQASSTRLFALLAKVHVFYYIPLIVFIHSFVFPRHRHHERLCDDSRLLHPSHTDEHGSPSTIFQRYEPDRGPRIPSRTAGEAEKLHRGELHRAPREL
jgi:hypothetical protein